MKLSDRFIGLILLIFASFILYEAHSFPLIPGQAIGSGLMPTIIGFSLIVCAIVLISSDYANPEREVLFVVGEWASDKRSLIQIAGIVGGVILYILLADILGFLIIGVLLILSLLLSFGVSIARALIVSLFAVVFIQLVFSKLLRVPLPWGVMQPFAW